MMAGSIPALLTASFMVTLPMVAAFMSRNVPPNVPIAVLQAETMTISFILLSSLNNGWYHCLHKGFYGVEIFVQPP